jgi:copper(I)-binding protein
MACSAALADVITRSGAIEILSPWARASVGTSRPAVAYVKIRNTGEQPDRLLRIESAIAGHAMLHESIQEDGVMKMAPLDGIDLPPRSEIELATGGTHIMLMDLQEPLVEGGRLPLTLSFQQAGTIHVEATIGSIAASQTPD